MCHGELCMCVFMIYYLYDILHIFCLYIFTVDLPFFKKNVYFIDWILY